ncbi:GNAT family N-acetyltransferase [Streptomyces olivaceus]|uniref:GNAT family N-acetyltransferase n=1 Tax=Streptomyces olivaceus TaxID=47716 RepID=UPI001CCD9F96|nr:GNAT family N-acetyltransferase [Streptomyces olivaceus]MBZ6229906.1 GNAT family N-acetyltransferase [Streptomyces olivaceus]
MTAVVRLVPGQRLRPYRDGIRGVYADTFGAPPWNEGPERADAYLDRLDTDINRPGFTAALALDGDAVIGWATAWNTPEPFPTERCYPQVAVALGAQRTRDWVCGAREVDELAVGHRARGTGVGARLLHAVTDDRADGRCWLLTSARASDTLRFYERAGWTVATHPAPGGTSHAALLGPRHPARHLASHPL